MTKVYVIYDERCVYSEREPVQFGSWSEEWNFEVDKATLEEPHWSSDYEEYDLPDIKHRDIIFAVVMIYSSGDSFGHSSGQGEIIWSFKDENLAHALRKKIEASGEDDYNFEFTTDAGDVIKISNPAADYFSRIINVDVEHVLVE